MDHAHANVVNDWLPEMHGRRTIESLLIVENRKEQ